MTNCRDAAINRPPGFISFVVTCWRNLDKPINLPDLPALVVQRSDCCYQGPGRRFPLIGLEIVAVLVVTSKGNRPAPIDSPTKCSSAEFRSCQQAISDLHGTVAFGQSCSCTYSNSTPTSLRRCLSVMSVLFVNPCAVHSERQLRDSAEVWRRRRRNKTTSHPIRHWYHKKRRRSFPVEPRLVSCTKALRRCLKHTACRRLWDLFVEQCPVENFQCRMKDKKGCSDAFEGIRWTDLPSCGCLDDHRLHGPECHWIELMTSHNKCIDELKQAGLIENGNGDSSNISLTGLWNLSRGEGFSLDTIQTTNTSFLSQPTTSPTLSRQQSPQLPVGAAVERDKEAISSITRSSKVAAPPTTVATKMTKRPPVKSATATTTPPMPAAGISPLTTSMSTPPEPKSLPPVPTLPRPKVAPAGRVYLPLRMSTFPKPLSDTEVQSSSGIVYRVGSTCQAAWEQCSRDKVCSWHLSEIRINCNDNIGCSHESCSPSLRRFSQYVDQTLHEHMLFCTCKPNDDQCLRLQKMLLPACTYIVPAPEMPSCRSLLQRCHVDMLCRTWEKNYFRNCHWDHRAKRCSNTYAACRVSLMKIRGTALEYDCYCPSGDEHCRDLQENLFFRNPCFEEARYTMVPSLFGRVKVSVSPRTHSTPHPTPVTTPLMSTQRTRKIFQEPLLKVSVKQQERPTAATLETVKVEPQPVTPTASVKMQTTITSPRLKAYAVPKTTETIFRPPLIGEVGSVETTSMNTSKTRRPAIVMTTTSVTKKTSTTTLSTTTVATTTIATTTEAAMCHIKDIEGKWQKFGPNEIFRNYSDVFFQCFAYCECREDLNILCHPIGCLPGESCKGPVMVHAFGSPTWIEERGLCTCISGSFICERPAKYELRDDGIFLFIGYAHNEVLWLSEHVPLELQYRFDFEEPEFIPSVIVERLQAMLKTASGENVDCRFAVYFAVTGNLILRVEKFHVETINGTSLSKWISGIGAKACKRPLKRMTEDVRKARYKHDAVLSLVKQIGIEDTLPPSSAKPAAAPCACRLVLLLLTLLLNKYYAEGL